MRNRTTGSRKRPRKRLTAEARREVIELAATELFAERGYDRASIDEIARLSGVSPPVVYDHFASKQALYRRLLERHTGDLLRIWREHLLGDEPPENRVPRALDVWARYVESHPFAWQMLFREATGDHEVQAVHRAVHAQSRAALARILALEPGAENLAGSAGQETFELAVELIRSGLTGLAVWWREHPQVPRQHVVTTAMNVLWVGYERALRGERWRPQPPQPSGM